MPSMRVSVVAIASASDALGRPPDPEPNSRFMAADDVRLGASARMRGAQGSLLLVKRRGSGRPKPSPVV